MKKILSSVKKTIYYARRNGATEAIRAAIERVAVRYHKDYRYVPPADSELENQRTVSQNGDILFTVIVPAYETPVQYLRELTDSVLAQTYSGFELIIADASCTDSVSTVISDYADPRIRYIKLPKNRGISENTNCAIMKAAGDYCLLLDHDDILTPDALYEMYITIRKATGKVWELPDKDQNHPDQNQDDPGINQENPIPAHYPLDKKQDDTNRCQVCSDQYQKNPGRCQEPPILIYSDEDKFDDEHNFFEPHKKGAFNFDLLLTNNYICHLACIRSDILKKYTLRPEYDGAQDYDLFLRIAGGIYDDYISGFFRDIEKKPVSQNQADFNQPDKPVQTDNHQPGGNDQTNVYQTIDRKPANGHLTANPDQIDFPDPGRFWGRSVKHVKRVLYHWRCHESSTAENPQSKLYAYEAGRSALLDLMKKLGWEGTVEHDKHLGFYRIKYSGGIFKSRPEVGAVSGYVTKHGIIISKAFRGKKAFLSGYMNCLDICRNTGSLDIRCLALPDDLHKQYRDITGHDYVNTLPICRKQGKYSPDHSRISEKKAFVSSQDLPDWMSALSDEDLQEINTKLTAAIKRSGRLIVLDPLFIRKM